MDDRVRVLDNGMDHGRRSESPTTRPLKLKVNKFWTWNDVRRRNRSQTHSRKAVSWMGPLGLQSDNYNGIDIIDAKVLMHLNDISFRKLRRCEGQ